jgi:hypothetical protein
MKKIILYTVTLLMIISAAVLPAFAAEDRGSAVVVYQPVDGAMGDGDRMMIDHLESLGFTVRAVIDSECVTADADGAALLVLLESVSSANVKEKFAAIQAPILCFEMAAWEDLGMGSQTGATGDVFPAVFGGNSEIENALSSKSFDLFTEAATMVPMDPSTVSPDALLIGENEEGNTLIAAYEKGAALIDGSAATSRRASGFVFGQTATIFTPQTWELRTAVINWLSPLPVVEDTTAEPETAELPAEKAPVAQTSDIIAVTLTACAAAAVILLQTQKKK